MSRWLQHEVFDLCRRVENICPAFGCHVALTGGLLYKEGPRKDADLLFYRIRQRPEIDVDGLLAALGTIGIAVTGGGGWCWKASYLERPVDLFFPDAEDGDYDHADTSHDEESP
jgi:hypothetical protein